MIHIFAGPTISAAEIASRLSAATVRPPAQVGDIYAACKGGATAVGLIDGFFEGVPSVWHKEILWALDQGISVFGASSMGALRAAELHAFGMVGVGEIFEAYRDGRLEADDAVALRHGPVELGYVALSVPLVNIRATLNAATAAQVIGPAGAKSLAECAERMFFPERRWDALLDQGAADGLDLAALKDWLPEGAVDQKHCDACTMLDVMAQGAPVSEVRFDFQHTVMWETLTRAMDDRAPDLVTRLILDQVRSDQEGYAALRTQAAAHMTASPIDISDGDVARALTAFRTEHRLYTGQALNDWLAARGMTAPALRESIADVLRMTALIEAHPAAYRRALMTGLERSGQLKLLTEQAQEMARALADAGQPDPDPDDLDLAPSALLIWYFETYQRRSVPADMDGHLAALDYRTRSEFEQMMARAYVLWHHKPELLAREEGAVELR